MALTKDRWLSFAVLTVIALLSALYLAAVSPYWKISPDSASYIAAAESLAAGEGYQVELHPPMTSLIYSVPAFVFPGNYLVMNGIVTVFALLSMFGCYVLFRRRVGSMRAGVVVMLSLGSIFLFRQSTLLLSDIFYLSFSIAAFVLVQNVRDKEIQWRGAIAVGIITLLACMTRVVGLALALAIFLDELATWLKKQPGSNFKPRLFWVMLSVVFCVMAWEYRNVRSGISYVELAVQVRPWVEESGYISVVGMVERLFGNVLEYRFVGAILSNHSFSDLGVPRLLGQMVAGLCCLLFAWGLMVCIKSRHTVTEVYCLIFLLVLGLYHPWIPIRLSLPLAPFFFFYALRGLEDVTGRSRPFLGRLESQLVQSTVLVYVLGYMATGLIHMRREIPQEWASPFGAYPIKYTHNYDLQRLGLWLKDHSSDTETYLSMHPNVMSFITQRKGYALPLSHNPDKLFGLLKENRIQYVLVDEKKEPVREYLIPVIQAHPDRFHLIKKEQDASLYRVQQRVPML